LRRGEPSTHKVEESIEARWARELAACRRQLYDEKLLGIECCQKAAEERGLADTRVAKQNDEGLSLG
jgi:hypothetical protein